MLLQVLVQAGAYVKDDACRALTIVIMNASQLHGYAVRALYTALSANVAGASAPLLMVATWCIGKAPLGVCGAGRGPHAGSRAAYAPTFFCTDWAPLALCSILA